MHIQKRGDDTREWQLYGGKGALQVEWYFRQTTALPSSVMLYHLEPGTEEGEHLHLEGHDDSCSAQSSDELYVVTMGEIVMVVDGERTTLRAGDSAYAPAGSLHGVANESDSPAELILVFGPPKVLALS